MTHGLSDLDVSDRTRRIHGTATTVDDGGPWVRLVPDAEAAAAPGGRPDGPLDGQLVAIKDLLAVAGLPLGGGSLTRTDAPPEPRDATVVSRLRRAGAVVAGTVALHELAFGVTGVNDQVGFPSHPTAPGHVPGGSSSGSAVVVATGQCDLAVGTDTGGSVRIPAALCGVVGFKPSRGTYPLDGVLPLAPTLDHVGLLGRDVFGVIGGHLALTSGDHPPMPPMPPMPRRVGVDRAAMEGASEPVATAVDDAFGVLREAGCELVELRWPATADAAAVAQVSTTILFAEATGVHRDLLGTPAFELLGPDLQARFEAGAAIDDDELRAALAERARIETAVRATLDTVDVVAGPTVPVVAPSVEQARDDPSIPQVLVSNTRLANVAGVPALSLPIPHAGSLPVGLQLVAGSDRQLLGDGLAVSLALASS